MAFGQQGGGLARHVVEPPQPQACALPSGLAAVGGCIRRAEKDIVEGRDLLAGAAGGERRGAERCASIPGRRLDEQPLHVRTRQDALVELHVEGAAASEGELPATAKHVAEVAVDQREARFLVGALQRGGMVDIRFVDGVAPSPRPVAGDEARTEVVPATVLLVAAQAHRIHQPGIHAHPTGGAARPEQRREIEASGIAVGRHAHRLVFAVEHLEAQVFGDGAIDAGKRVRLVELEDARDAPTFADAEERRRVLALAVHAENRHFALKAGQVVGARRMGEMVLHRHEARPRPVDAELAPQVEDPPAVAAEAPIAVEDGVEGPLRRIPVAAGVVPARRAEEGNRRIGAGDGIDIPGGHAGSVEAVAGRFERQPPEGVLLAHEAFLLRRSCDPAVHQQGGGRIVPQGAGQAQDDQSASQLRRQRALSRRWRRANRQRQR